jgi:hypothetical protein
MAMGAVGNRCGARTKVEERLIIIRWTIALGVVGFVCGFFDPMLLAPEANQDRCWGFLSPGRKGVVLGAILGFVVADCACR